jgi:hypothetical protein
VLALFALVLTAITRIVPLRSDAVKQRIVSTLAWRLDRDVALDDLSVRIFPRLRAEGSGLVVRQRGRTDIPPLISIRTFTVDADLLGLVRKHVGHVEVRGLEINVPPSPDNDGNEQTDESRKRQASRADNTQRRSSAADDSRKQAAVPDRATGDPDSLQDGVVIDALTSTDARLTIIPRKLNKAPRMWLIHSLRMRGVGISRSMPFEATLTNAIPPGEIGTSGHFGPWDRDEPASTPLKGTFEFANANLSVFHGISGMLFARGSFGGSLGRIDVTGETDTKDFTIEVGGHPFPLHTKYHTIVDATNGNTQLEHIEATFLKSTLVAHGSVLDGPPGRRGRTVTLDINMPRARVEDVMTMAVKTPKPPMTGSLQLTTRFLLPPGETDVVDRLKLDGRFTMARTRFTNIDVQAKINELSHRSRGLPPDAPQDGVLSNFNGRFRLGNGRLDLQQLAFDVPGAQVQLAGGYGLKDESLGFRGTLTMDAKISQTQKGFKSLLLKAVDPLFKKRGGGSVIPIKIDGRRDDPQFGLDMGRVLKRGDDF